MKFVNSSHVLFAVVHDVILKVNVDVGRQSARTPFSPQLKESGYATIFY